MSGITCSVLTEFSFWAYTNCDQICDGLEIDNYTNGMSRVRGVFHSGKPSEIERFREDGTLEQKEYFVLGTISRTRVNYYNLDGLLDSYEIIRNRKKKTITLTYNSSGMLVNKSTVRHNIEKNR